LFLLPSNICTVNLTYAIISWLLLLFLAREKGVDLNTRLHAFGWDENPFVTLDITENMFQPYGQMWTEFAEFRANRQGWLNESFLQLDGVQVRDQVERTWVNSYKMAKRFAK
jgi:hypothetical protein